MMDLNAFPLAEGTTTDVVRKVTATLAEAGVRVICCGGAAREAYHFRTPKDFDFLVLYSPLDSYGPIDDVQAEMVNWAFYKDTEYSDIEMMLNYDDSSLQLHWVVKAKYKGQRIDIISTRKRCDTPEQAVQALDTTLNAAWIDLTGPQAQCRVLPGVYPSVLDDFPVRLMYPKSCTVERINYLRDKYPQYRYDIRAGDLLNSDIQGTTCAES